jgi:hypothetical protein
MQLDWTAALRPSASQRQTITAEFLEPFSSADNPGQCSNYTTCLACSTDTACGWCDTDAGGACVSRTPSSVDQCIASSGSLVVYSAHCPVCADHVDCSSCVQVS